MPWKTNSTPSWSSFYLHVCHIYVSHHRTNTSEDNPLKDTMQLQNDGFIYEGGGVNSKSSSAATTTVTETFTVLWGILTHSPQQNCSNSTPLEGFGAWTAPLGSQQLDFSLDWTFYFVFDKPVWGEPAGVFCCTTKVLFSLRQWSDIQMFSISTFRHTESQCRVPPDRHTTSMYDWWNSAEISGFGCGFLPCCHFYPTSLPLSHEFWPYLRPVCFNII